MARPPSKQQPTGADVVTDARRYLGIPYVFGGGPANPRAGLDCSGLVMRVALDLGYKNCPRTSEEQFKWAVPTEIPGPGDLVFFVGAPEEAGPPGHVGIVVSPGVMIDAPHTGTTVSVQHFDARDSGLMGYGKFPGLTASATANPATGGQAPGAVAAAGAGVFAGVGTALALLLLAVVVLVGLFIGGVMLVH